MTVSTDTALYHEHCVIKVECKQNCYILVQNEIGQIKIKVFILDEFDCLLVDFDYVVSCTVI